MSMLAIILGTLIIVLVGRFAFGHFYNHVSLYAAVWGGALALFDMRLINYYPIEDETWALIYSGSFCFIIGALTVWAYHRARTPNFKKIQPAAADFTNPELRTSLTRILWFLNVLTFAVVIQHWYAMSKVAGGFAQVLLFSNLMYSFRVEWGIPGSIPYIKCLALLGALLGGVLTALSGRAKLVAVVPLVIIFLGEIVSAGRSLLVQGGIFFLTGYFSTRFHIMKRYSIRAQGGKFRGIIGLIIALAVIAGGIEFVRESRGGETNYAGYTSKLSSFRGSILITPSIYLYITSNFGILNQYLKHDNENVPWGANSFGPVYHVLDKLGFDTHIGTYQRFYLTPSPTNLGTYLREAHEDFGILGIFFFPYFLGLITSVAWFSLVRKFRFGVLVLLGSLVDIIVMALFVISTRGGDLYIVMIVGFFVGTYLDKRAKVGNAETNTALVPAS